MTRAEATEASRPVTTLTDWKSTACLVAEVARPGALRLFRFWVADTERPSVRMQR
jgi:hypothetical protein